MKFFAKLLVIPALLFLGACEGGVSLLGKFKEYQSKGETYAAKGLSEVVTYRCTTMSELERANLLDSVNNDLAAKGSLARASALDCDGDGQPDPVGEAPE